MAGNPNIREAGKETRFKRGQSGNPGGRPAGASLTALVRAELSKPCVEGSSVTKREMLAGMIVDRAIAGDDAMIVKVWAYEDGNPVSKNENGEPGDFGLSVDEVRKAIGLRVVKDKAG